MNKKPQEKQEKIVKQPKNYDLAQDIMPKENKVEASLMHKNRFEK